MSLTYNEQTECSRAVGGAPVTASYANIENERSLACGLGMEKNWSNDSVSLIATSPLSCLIRASDRLEDIIQSQARLIEMHILQNQNPMGHELPHAGPLSYSS